MNEDLKEGLKQSLTSLIQLVLAQESPNALTLDGKTPAQLAEDILKGTAENANKLGGKTLSEIVALATGGSDTAASVKLQLDEFIALRNNPHVVTKDQINLGRVNNWAVASSQEAFDGVSTTLYVTPANVTTRVQRAVDALVGAAPEGMNTIEKLAAVLGNDPEYFATVVKLIEGKLAIDGTADNSAKLGGVSAADYATVKIVDEMEANLLDSLQTVTLELSARYQGQITPGTMELMGQVIYGYREPDGAAPMGTMTPPTFSGRKIVLFTWRDDTKILTIVISGDQTAHDAGQVLFNGIMINKQTNFEYQEFNDETTVEFDIDGLTMPLVGTFDLYF